MEDTQAHTQVCFLTLSHTHLCLRLSEKWKEMWLVFGQTMSTLSCVPPGLECVRQKGKKYIVLSRMGVYLATRGSKHCSFMHMGSINTDRNDCRNNESADLKCLPRKWDYSKKVQASSMINADTNIPGNKEICHFLRQSIKQHVQMFPKQHKDGLLWRSSGWPGLISQMRRSKTSGTELIRWSAKCWFTSLHSLPRVKPIICRTRRNAFGHAEPNCGH